MLALNLMEIARIFRHGAVVEPAPELLGVQGPDGELVPGERLGPGVVEQTDQEGRVRVRWVDAGLEAWVDASDLRPMGSGARLLTVKRRDWRGNTRLLRHRVVEDAGLQHNWTVELLPRSVVRTLRPDGAAWTFNYNWDKRVVVWWPQPPDDDDAEAYTVAEIALSGQL